MDPWPAHLPVQAHCPCTEAEPDGKERDSLITPVFLTSSYVFESTSELKRYFEGGVEREEYGRYGNPTVPSGRAKNRCVREHR